MTDLAREGMVVTHEIRFARQVADLVVFIEAVASSTGAGGGNLRQPARTRTRSSRMRCATVRWQPQASRRIWAEVVTAAGAVSFCRLQRAARRSSWRLGPVS
jgi:hypothetical protein